MSKVGSNITRRSFLKGAAATSAAFTIVPAHVLGGNGRPAPSDTFGGALIGVGGMGPGTYRRLSLPNRQLAQCDVKWVGQVDNRSRYTDFRRVLERKDIDLIAIATPPHWHALISIAAMQAGKDVLCEKPMTRFIGEGRAVAEAEKRYGRVFQVGTFGRFGQSRREEHRKTRRLLASGLIKKCDTVVVRRGGFKVKEWSGPLVAPSTPPDHLDWDMYCGPSPLVPYQRPRFGGMHRGYWDYDGGGLGDMGQHHLDPIAYTYALDTTAPVEVEAYAPPAHPIVTGMWGWVKLRYANGFTLVLESGEWPDRDARSGEQTRNTNFEYFYNLLSEEDKRKFDAMPDEEPLLDFASAVRARKPAGGNAEAAHRTMTIMHLANIAIRVGRTIRFDPVTEQVIGDDEANRLAHQPMRAPWHL
ncbi:MAG: Gfo/Idh/MocA family oxidoreductase [Phycisphaeraceae bacterium]|nr:Gfo/Idh/MocA family oxidoreductase [Phycisphaeraceae bacterium]